MFRHVVDQVDLHLDQFALASGLKPADRGQIDA